VKRDARTKKPVCTYGEPTRIELLTIDFVQKRERLLQKRRVFFALDETEFGRQGRPEYWSSKVGKILSRKKRNMLESRVHQRWRRRNLVVAQTSPKKYGILQQPMLHQTTSSDLLLLLLYPALT